VIFGRSSRFGRLERLRPDVFAELKSAVEKGLSKAGPMLFMQLTKAHPDSERLELFPAPSKELFAIITFQ
jgi:hypothetical protein